MRQKKERPSREASARVQERLFVEMTSPVATIIAHIDTFGNTSVRMSGCNRFLQFTQGKAVRREGVA